MNDRFSADDLPRSGRSARPLSPWPVDLAHIRPFRIGFVEVRPATREVIGGDRREVIEPRVMQVLVTLNGARGEILSRDDLIDACWEGRAVSDDSINRVISRLRALARTFESFRIETITKVGYRLVGDDTEEQPVTALNVEPRTASQSLVTRRSLIAGSGAAAVLGTGAALWQRPWRHRPPAEAVDFFHRAEIALRQGLPNQSRQAITFYEQALRIDPLYAEAWGALALANTHLLEGYGEVELGSVPDRIRSAARRALELDSNNADAQLALILINPMFRNWAQIEADIRNLLKRHPRQWLALGRLADLLFEVGRLDEGIDLTRRTLEIDPMLPIAHAHIIRSLFYAGREQEAETQFAAVQGRWPAHPSLWSVRFNYLLFSGRPQSAAAFVMDPDSLPSGYGNAETDPRLSLARAVETKNPADIDASIDDFLRMAAKDVTDIPNSATVFALLGRPDLTFASLERYFFNRGTFGPPAPIGHYTRRYTSVLFSPPIMQLRSDPRFGRLLGAVGLEDYWRKTGTLPDYRAKTA